VHIRPCPNRIAAMSPAKYVVVCGATGVNFAMSLITLGRYPDPAAGRRQRGSGIVLEVRWTMCLGFAAVGDRVMVAVRRRRDLLSVAVTGRSRTYHRGWSTQGSGGPRFSSTRIRIADLARVRAGERGAGARPTGGVA